MNRSYLYVGVTVLLLSQAAVINAKEDRKKNTAVVTGILGLSVIGGLSGLMLLKKYGLAPSGKSHNNNIDDMILSCNTAQLSRGVLNTPTQEEIWNLISTGKESEAIKFEKELKEFMKGSEIIGYDSFDGSGNNKRILVTLEGGTKCLFKPYTFSNISMNYKSEVAAYELDRLIGLNRVPVTVVREINGCTGSLQYFIDNTDQDPGTIELTNNLKFFDYLIRNWDRDKRDQGNCNIENCLFKNKQEIAIDHGWAFRTYDFYHEGRIDWSLSNDNIQNFCPSIDLYKKVESMSDEVIKNTLSPLLSDRQINGVINRKNAFFDAMKKD